MLVPLCVDVWAVLECQVLGKLILVRQLHCTTLTPEEQGHTAADTGLGAHTLLKLFEQDWLLASNYKFLAIRKNDGDAVFNRRR